MTDAGQPGKGEAAGQSENSAQQIHVHVANPSGGGKTNWTTVALAVLGLLTAGVTSYATYLNAELDDLGEEVAALGQERDALVTERDDLDRQKTLLSDAVKGLEEQQEALSAESAETRAQLEATEARLDELERSVAEAEQSAAEAEQKVANAERRGCSIAKSMGGAAKNVRTTTRKAPGEIIKVPGLPSIFVDPIRNAVRAQLRPLDRLAQSLDKESARLRKDVGGC